MICVSLGNISVDECLEIISRVEMAEIRLDLMSLSLEDIQKIFSSHPALIATCRRGPYPERKRKQFLLEAADAGAAYLDLDLEEDKNIRPEVERHARAAGARLILSHHDPEKTPAFSELKEIVERAFSCGADLVKIACFCQEMRDNARLLALLADPRSVVVCGMGPLGIITRVAAPFCGSPFTYASWEGVRPTAPGQISYQNLKFIWELFRPRHDHSSKERG